MHYFTAVPEAQAIVHARGVYRQVPLFEREGRLYAKQGTGFVRLFQGGATSAPAVRWAEIDPGEGGYAEAQGHVRYLAPVGAIEGSATPALAAE